MFAGVAVLGGLALLWATQTPSEIPKPLELTSQAELMLQFNLKPEDEIPPPQTGKAEDDKGQGVKDPGAKDPKPQGGGKKVKGDEGKLGKNGDAKETHQTGEIKAGLGGMSEALSSDVGDEVRKTLGTISSVADALGGLRSEDVVLGAGSGTGLHGGGNAGGGTEEGGVPFGSGTLDTGWGPGRGGGFGSGSGGPGGRGPRRQRPWRLGRRRRHWQRRRRRTQGCRRAKGSAGSGPHAGANLARRAVAPGCLSGLLRDGVGARPNAQRQRRHRLQHLAGRRRLGRERHGLVPEKSARRGLHAAHPSSAYTSPAADKPTNAAFPFAFRASKK